MKTIKSSIKKIKFQPITPSVLADVHNSAGILKATLNNWSLDVSIDVGSNVLLVFQEKDSGEEHRVTVGALFQYPADLQEELEHREIDRLAGGATIINQFGEFVDTAESLGFRCKEECEETSDENYTWMWGVGILVHVDLCCDINPAHDESEVKNIAQLAQEVEGKVHELTANLPGLCEIFRNEASMVDV